MLLHSCSVFLERFELRDPMMYEPQQQEEEQQGIIDNSLLLDHHQLNTNAREWIPPALRQEEDTTKSATMAGVISSLKVGKEFIPSGRYSSDPGNTSRNDPNEGTGITRYPKNDMDTTEGEGFVISQQQGGKDGFKHLHYYSHTNDPLLCRTTSSRKSTLHSLGCGELLWNYYRNATFDTLREMDPSDPLRKAVPTTFVNIYCLDRTPSTTATAVASAAGTFGYPSHVFKVVSTEDGGVYCLRRFDNTKLSNRIAATVTERWASIAHPGICTLHRCFLNQRAAFFLHDYCVGSSTSTITQFYLSPTNTTPTTTTTNSNNNHNTISERLLWSYIIQLTSVLRYLHSRGLACRSLHPNHVLLVGGGNPRIRLSCCGVLDALEFEARKTIAELQQEDLLNLGRLILSIATNTKISSTTNTTTLRSCEAFLVQRFSSDLHNLVRTLLYSGNTNPSISSNTGTSSTSGYAVSPHPLININSLCSMISHRIWDELDMAHTVTDSYSEELSKCYDNTRALRLLIKLGFINERPEFGMDTQWSETGDRYVIKLFRDYVFHQAREDGSPVLDLGHIITSLNKLDAADPEKIVLVSRDGESLLVVSYADISRCVEEAYQELCYADTNLVSTTSTTIGEEVPPPRLTSTTSSLVSSSGIPSHSTNFFSRRIIAGTVGTATTNITTPINSFTTPPFAHRHGNQNLTHQQQHIHQKAVRNLTSSHQPPIPMSQQQQEYTMGYSRGGNPW